MMKLLAASLLLHPVHANHATCDGKKLFDAPSGDHGAWLAKLKSWRKERQKSYTGEVYEEPSLYWTRTSFLQPQIHVYDRYLYDGSWTVDRYLDDLQRRFGGIDSVLIWPTYTNIGIDERNQFDYYRVVPGGLPAVTSLTEAFHRRGVRVLWGYNPWDQATRQEGSHWEVLAELLKETGGDGFNGDTMPEIPRKFWSSALQRRYPIAAEPEDGGIPCGDNWTAASWTPLGWGYFSELAPDHMTRTYDFAPGVDRIKWLDTKGRHLTHVCDRWSKNRTAAVQLAFFNGDGYEVWENVWGLFNRITDRDAELVRRAGALLRWAGDRNFTHDFEEWVPHAPEATWPEQGIFASRFQSGGDSLWLLINKGSNAKVTMSSESQGFRFYDLYHGLKLSGPQIPLSLEGGSVSALLATKHSANLPSAEFLRQMRAMTAQPLASISPKWEVLLPRAQFNFSVSGTEYEGGCLAGDDPHGVCCSGHCESNGTHDCQCGTRGSAYFGVDVQFPWESRPDRNHRQALNLGPLLMDRDLVTNKDFLSYLNASGYHPSDDFNFLKHWRHGAPLPGDEEKPVVNVGHEEAKAYCNFYGKRLPHSYEWQYGAQGLDARRYPWGNTWDPAAVPSPGHDPEKIRQHPKGVSPFGLQDMVGNVWQYTDSFRDEHTRAVLLRGSSRYNPVVSDNFPAVHQSTNWYFPAARELGKHSKYFLMSNSYERAGTLGFRCAADVIGGPLAPHHFRTEAVQFV